MRIAFLGTPDFALPSLRALCDEGHELRVFTQPDRKKGRGCKCCMPPVKELALELGIPVEQFEKISSPEGVEALTRFSPQLMVTVAFGQILSREILDIPTYGCINVHGSLLPEYRGASPIQQAVLDGKKVTGVTTMMTDVGLDTGDILLARETPICENETSGELSDRLAVLGAQVLTETLRMLSKGELVRHKQDDSRATRCRTIKKEQGKIDFSRSAEEIHNLVRGMNPWPLAYGQLCGNTVKIHETALRPDMKTDAKPGTCIIASPKQGLFVATGDGVLEIKVLQCPSCKALPAKAFLNSKNPLGECFS